MIKDLLTLGFFKTNADKLLASAYTCLGSNQHDSIDKEVGCAESVSNVIKNVILSFSGSPSTGELYNLLSNSNLFIKVTNFQAGDIIISPTGINKNFNNPDMLNGHTGIVGINNNILSNNSATGLFDIHYTIDSWVARYRTLGGYKIYFFRLK